MLMMTPNEASEMPSSFTSNQHSEPTLVEKMFQVTDARVCSARELGNRFRAQEIFDNLRALVETSRRERGREAHGVSVILRNSDFRLIDVFPVTFSAAQIHLPSLHGRDDVAVDWKEALFTRLNGGITE